MLQRKQTIRPVNRGNYLTRKLGRSDATCSPPEQSLPGPEAGVGSSAASACAHKDIKSPHGKWSPPADPSFHRLCTALKESYWITCFYFPGNCIRISVTYTYVTIFYSIRGIYSPTAIIKCRKTIKENNWGRNWGLNDCWFRAPPPIMRQTSSTKSILHISLVYHNIQNTHPSNWYLSFKTLNIQCQQYQPRQ